MPEIPALRKKEVHLKSKASLVYSVSFRAGRAIW